MTEERARGVMGGLITYAAMMSLYQDAIGRAAYIASVESHWVSAAFSVPVAIMGLMAGLWLLNGRVRWRQ